MEQELRTDTLFAVRLNVDPQAAAACTARQANEFLHIAQEALTNIRKHAEATTIQMRFQFSDGLLQMTIQDDGIGFDQVQARLSPGNGLRNIRERHGRCTASSVASHGRVRVRKLLLQPGIESRRVTADEAPKRKSLALSPFAGDDCP